MEDPKITIIQPKNDIIKSNLLQLKEIEKFQRCNPFLSMEEAATKWISKHARKWRDVHTLMEE